MTSKGPFQPKTFSKFRNSSNETVANSRLACCQLLSPVTCSPLLPHLRSFRRTDKRDRKQARNLTLITAQEDCIMKKVQEQFQGKAKFVSGYVQIR